MGFRATVSEIEHALANVPVIDIHTHLVGGRLGARGLHDILLYHMVVSDFYAAGCPDGNRLTQFPAWPDNEECHRRLRAAIPLIEQIQNTSSFWGVRLILKDLYDWHEPITIDNWQRLDHMIRERADDREFHHSILDRLQIQRTGTEIARRGMGEDDQRLQYSLEWGFFTRCQWGEFDTALYELERCWGRNPESPSPIGTGARPEVSKIIRTLDDVHAALEHYVRNIPVQQIVSTATHISTDIDYRLVSASEMETALARRSVAGPAERDIFASYVHEALLTAMELQTSDVVFQFSLGAEPLPKETSSRISQRTIMQLAEMIGRHPKLHFQCMLSSRHANQSICSLARELPNLSLMGYWWHNFFPGTIRQVFEERLDMLPANKHVGFFSDAYSVEWVYAKLAIARRQMADVFAHKVIQGQFSIDETIAIARRILFESPQSLLRMQPKVCS